MTTLTFRVPGKPAGKARPRFNRATGTVYSPDVGLYQVRVAEHGLQAGLRLVEGPVEVHIRITRRMPSSWSKKRRKARMGEAATNKPDGNNILAGVLDGLTGILVADDKDVWRCSVEKRWGEADNTMITVGWEDNASHPTVKGSLSEAFGADGVWG